MTGQKIGYIRVSSGEQNTVRQLDGVVLDKVFTDTCSGHSTNRPQLTLMLDFVRDGDTIVVHSMDRLARNLDDLRKEQARVGRVPVRSEEHTSELQSRGL